MASLAYTLENHIADSGRLAERTALRLLLALASEAEALFHASGLRDGLSAADVAMDGEPELVRIRETISASDPRRLAARAPEAAVAGASAATERAVVFALGLVAFHALSGTPAFQSDGESGRRAVPVYDLRARRVSEKTIELLRRATARDAAERPKRIRSLRIAAERILKKTRWDGDRPACVERRSPLALLAVAMAALAALGALFYFRVGPFQAERVTQGLARLFSASAETERREAK